MPVEEKPNLTFQCDNCGKKEIGGNWYLSPPENWIDTYLDYQEERELRYFCSIDCFENCQRELFELWIVEEKKHLLERAKLDNKP